MPGLGEEFRAAREARHLSLSDVSEQIHIRSVYLKSIEDEKWGEIAAPVYVRGFIRTYARFLGIEPENAVERYNTTLGEGGGAPQVAFSSRGDGAGSPSLWVWLAGAAALILVIFVAYNYYEFQTSERGRAPAATASAGATFAPKISLAGSASPRSTPSSTPQRTFAIRLTGTSWLHVETDGVARIEGTFPSGTAKSFTGKKSAEIRAGDAGFVDVVLNGKDLGPLGAAGAVVDKTYDLVGK